MTHNIKSLLLVDDDQDYKYFFYKALEKVDPEVHVITADDGLDALQKLETNTPDVILIDFNMPRMNGLSLLKHIKNTPELKNLPVVVYSTFPGLFDSEEITNLGAVHVYTKPVSFQDTVKMVGQILDLSDGIKNCA